VSSSAEAANQAKEIGAGVSVPKPTAGGTSVLTAQAAELAAYEESLPRATVASSGTARSFNSGWEAVRVTVNQTAVQRIVQTSRHIDAAWRRLENG
jgi:hypothetical protein